MSRADRVVERRNDSRAPRFVGDFGPGYPTSRSGDSWWRSRYADMVERRVVVRRPRGHSEVRYERLSTPLVVLARRAKAQNATIRFRRRRAEPQAETRQEG